jgi:D-alanine-D-alanine ligase
MTKFRKVAVLKGGPSSEREVSLRSGAAVARGLTEAGYDVTEIDVKDSSLDLPAGTEAVFIALHGEFGEDGQVQALLETKGIPYTGSNAEASRASFDKLISRRLLAEHGVPIPAGEVLRAGDRRTQALPLVVKPPRQGSSIGVHRVFHEKDWAPALADALTFGREVLVEQFIPGRELTVGIVGRETLPVIEVLAPDGWYDYTAKYTRGRTEYQVPARMDASLEATCRELALRTFDALGCRGLGRVDIRATPDGHAYVLELNNIPGFTETSLLPKAAACTGLNFSALCDRIMSSARLG